MKKSWVLTQESFDALLDWLGPERDQAGQKYEHIRTRLIKIFTCRGCYEPEELADETINRVISRISEIQGSFEGDQTRYFCGVASKVYLEYRRRKQVQPTLIQSTDSARVEAEFSCLEQCLGQLSSENRELVLHYYQSERKAKIEQRKLLAKRLGIAPNALRIRAHRIRMLLQECVENCLERYF
jgi:DNA-directed RNA polymerase specialized sigma24 family protein